ncbi:hypothetical protein FWG95_00990 [Candidatus Saccharibacteria bacterium]|nr:hypothetical protein [Candidatus Saccharibacteria bacterium]
MTIEIFTMIIAGLFVAGMVGLFIWGVRSYRRGTTPFGQALDSLLESFQQRADELSTRYAEEFALMRFLEQAEAEGREINIAQFQQDTLNVVNLLRIEHLKIEISKHVAGKAVAAEELAKAVESLAQYGGGGRGSNVKRLKELIATEETYIDSLQDQLMKLKLHIRRPVLL